MNINQLCGFCLSFSMIIALTENNAYSVVCQQNYYPANGTCYSCPSFNGLPGRTKSSGASSLKDCYISATDTIKDTTGEYTLFSSDCYYTVDSAPTDDWSRQEIIEAVVEILNDITGEDIRAGDISPETTIHDMLVWLNMDSLDGVTLVLSLEEKFDISIPLAEASRWVTVDDMIDYIHNEVF